MFYKGKYLRFQEFYKYTGYIKSNFILGYCALILLSKAHAKIRDRFYLFIYNDNEQMKNLSKEEFVHILRRHSNGFSRGSSKYRGVTLHKCGRWEARMGQLLGKK
jgi:hypothetical protein